MNYTVKQKEWLIRNYPILSETNLNLYFYKEFGVHKSGRTLNTYCRTVLKLTKPNPRGYTIEESDWLLNNYPMLGRTECTRQFNERFNRDKTPRTIEKFCHKSLGIHCDKSRLVTRYNEIRKPLGYQYRNCRGEWKVKTEDGWIPLSHLYYNVPKGFIAFHLDGDLNNNDPDNIVIIKNGMQTIIYNYGMKSQNANITKVALTWCELYLLLKKEGICYGN